MSSSPAEPSGEPVELFLIGRTLRGTLGEAFRRQAIARFESLHDGGVDGDGDGGADAPAPHSGLSRTVELTAVAVTRAGTVIVDAGIADPAFRSAIGSVPPSADEGERVFEVAVEEIEGIRPVAGPSGVDRSRRVVVQVRPDLPGATLAIRVSVLLPE